MKDSDTQDLSGAHPPPCPVREAVAARGHIAVAGILTGYSETLEGRSCPWSPPVLELRIPGIAGADVEDTCPPEGPRDRAR